MKLLGDLMIVKLVAVRTYIYKLYKHDYIDLLLQLIRECGEPLDCTFSTKRKSYIVVLVGHFELYRWMYPVIQVIKNFRLKVKKTIVVLPINPPFPAGFDHL